ncbi:MAG: hypothetical protein IT305_11505 [Chloroflexi bacterium]|nr:hypothetical protein [Chloroflexota bacterium]
MDTGDAFGRLGVAAGPDPHTPPSGEASTPSGEAACTALAPALTVVARR